MNTQRPDRKFLKRFLEPLVLLQILNRTQGDRIPEQYENISLTTLDNVRQKRAILANLCQVCDHKKGGATVTAIAAQNKPDGPTYWLASNTDAHEYIVPFLQQTLTFLGNATSATDVVRVQSRLEGQLFIHFANFNRPYLHANWKLLQKAIGFELERIGRIQRPIPQREDYIRWLEGFQGESGNDLEWLLKVCRRTYDARESCFIRQNYLSQVEQSPNPVENSEYQVRHYLGRLGSILRAAKILAQAPFIQPVLFENFQIKACALGGPINGPGTYKALTIEGIARRMLPAGSKDLEPLVSALKLHDRMIDLMEQVRSEYTKDSFKPRVHAELAVLESVHRARIDFYDNDKYIACSKPACFCCYHYICLHPGQFVRPASHNKVWVNWRAPDVPDMPGGGRHFQLKLLDDLITQIRQAAMKEAFTRNGPTFGRPDTTSGITSTTGASPRGIVSRRRIQVTRDRLEVSQAQGDTESDSEDGGVSLLTTSLADFSLAYQALRQAQVS